MELERVRTARAVARSRAWQAGAAPPRVVFDFDATPIDSHSEKGLAAGHYQGGVGFNPLLVTCGREVLAGILWPGNTGANNAADHRQALERTLDQVPRPALDGPILARADSAGASHDFAFACRETDIRFSLGYAIQPRCASRSSRLPESTWRPALNANGEPREGSWVAELTGRVNLDSWPEGTRLICRRERPHPARNCRSPIWTGIAVSASSPTKRATTRRPGRAASQHAEVEDRVKTLKATGGSHLPFHSFAANAAWFELALLAHDTVIRIGGWRGEHAQRLDAEDARDRARRGSG